MVMKRDEKRTNKKSPCQPEQGSTAKSVIVWERREPVPQREPMGLYFSAPDYST